jgi:hypothetical protein
MSPDIKRKYESRRGEFEVTSTVAFGTDVRDIGDKSFIRETVTGKSGLLKSMIYPEVGNPMITTIEEIVTPTSETASMSSIEATPTPTSETSTMTSEFTTSVA